MMRALEIIAGSWPIAVMVVGIASAIVVRRCIKQAMDNGEAARRDRAEGNRAVVVAERHQDSAG